MRRLLLSFLLALVFLFAACEKDDILLSVDVQTGLVPGPEFARIETTLFRTAGGRFDSNEVDRIITRDVRFPDRFERGRRVAEFGGITPGVRSVRVRLFRPAEAGGALLVERWVRVKFSGSYALLVRLDRDCVAATCPSPGGSPAFTECLVGRCVDPECDLSDPTTYADHCCDPAAPASDCPNILYCNDVSECVAVGACAEAQCIDGACVESPIPDACAPVEWCDPSPVSGGCRPLVSVDDAGPRDAGVDASEFDAGESDSGVDAGESDAGVDAGDGDMGTTPVDPDLGFDSGAPDLGVDAGFDAGAPDLGVDAGFDAGAPDLGVDPWTGRVAVYVKASNTDPGDEFGTSIALSADGSTLAVGSLREASAATGIDGVQMNNAAGSSGAVYVYRRLAGGGWAQEAYVKPSNTGGDFFGVSIALSADGSTLAVGAHLEDSAAVGVDGDGLNDAAYNAGAAYVFRRTLGTWSQEAYVKATNTEVEDAFGISVALSGDGTVLAVGAPSEDSTSRGVDGSQTADLATDANLGAVYVYRRSGARWAPEAYVKASNSDDADAFGSALALSERGEVLIVGAPYEASSTTGVGGPEENNDARESGAVYVFRAVSGVWGQEAYVKASNTGASDQFGGAVALSADGAVLAIGAFGEASASTGVGGVQTSDAASYAGAVYVFRRSATWAQQAYLKASNTAAGDWFGCSVALSADGATLAVGASVESSAATGIGGDQASNAASGSGAVYVFRDGSMGWEQAAYVKAPNTGAFDAFGRTVAVATAGVALAVAAPFEDSAATGIGGDDASDAAFGSGAAYVY
jgi:hypothetical protein